MKIIERMLKKWIEIPENILELTNQKIIEVDSFEPLNPSTNLVVGHVLTCEDHPSSDHLHVTTVDLGDRVEQIVCGAANVAKDQYVIVAQVGTVLPGDFKIKSTTIRGVSSNGMICSLNELGLDEKLIPKEFSDGIFYFEGPREIGTNALPQLELDGFVMELGLTPNRSDLLSHLGFAYDVASMTNQTVNINPITIKENKEKNPISVSIQTEGCGRYYARYFSQLVVKESPWWLKNALLASDIKPINNVVDISNYVLIEYGTPLHMFDADKVGSKEILVRDAKEGEQVISLDEEKRILTKDDVVITNGKNVIAIGGVMGLENTMIDENTNKVILEAAYFEPKRIFHTSKRLGLRSDSSVRFERGIDDKRVILGLERATELLIELADAVVTKGISEAIHHEKNNPTIEISKTFFNDALGISLDEKDLLDYFVSYNYQYEFKKDSYLITAPSYRTDILIKADLLEEIARMYGLDRIPMRPSVLTQQGKLSHKQKRIRMMRHHLASLGLNEVITYSLIAPSEVHDYQNIGEAVSVLMPLSEDKKTLRQSLVHGLLETVSYNQSRQLKNVSIFEIGNCFAKGVENLHLGIAMSGVWHETPWKKEAIKPSFFTVKGILDQVLSKLSIEVTYKETNHNDKFHPYRQANIYYQDLLIGQLAELHPLTAKHLNIEPTITLDINLEPLIKENIKFNYEPISKYPNISRDLAIVVDEKVPANDLISMMKQTIKKNLVSVDVFDVYQGSHIETGKKSIAFSLVFNDQQKTLESEDVDQMMKKITNRLSFSFQAIIRS